MGTRTSIILAALAVFCAFGVAYALADPSGFPGVRQAVASPAGAGLVPVPQEEEPQTLPATVADPDTVQADQPETSELETPAPSQQPATETTPEQGPPPYAPFGFDAVIEKARGLSKNPYIKMTARLPSSVANLNYEQYLTIKERPERADWSDNGQFRVHYAVQGFLFKDPVTINLVENGTASKKNFDPSRFDFYNLPISEEDKASLGYSGLKLSSPLNQAGKFDEFLSFQGASYFRALGVENQYGASARGLALATASPTGEEFPVFREFWLQKPVPGSDTVTVLALLDSVSITGAYRFTSNPGATTVIEVEAVLFPRRDVNHVGIAPLTSMFDFGPQDPIRSREDFRPRVHDSEGLMIRMSNGEWVWRPLTNPTQLEISSFTRDVPYGFGLMQRTRDFNEFQDLEARYDLRPSVWIEPMGEWDDGSLVLVEIPTANEFNDNIVAYWRPGVRWEEGSEHRLSYRMFWGDDAPLRPPIAQVASTRMGVPVNNPNNRLFVLEFVSGNPALLDGSALNVSSSAGQIVGPVLLENPVTGGRRLTFELDPQGSNVAELRVALTRAGEPVSETWLYRWRR